MKDLLNVANGLTFSRIVLTPVIMWLIIQRYWWTAIIVFTIASITDSYDGKLARYYEVETDLGNFLDPLADKVLIIGTFLAFCLVDFLPYWFLAILLLRDIFITALRMAMRRVGQPLKTSYLGKLKTFLQIKFVYILFVAALFAYYDQLVLFFYFYFVVIAALIGITGLTIYSAIDYYIKNKEAIKKLYSQGS